MLSAKQGEKSKPNIVHETMAGSFLSAHRCPQVDLPLHRGTQMPPPRLTSSCLIASSSNSGEEDERGSGSDWSEDDLSLHFSASVISPSSDEESDPESGVRCVTQGKCPIQVKKLFCPTVHHRSDLLLRQHSMPATPQSGGGTRQGDNSAPQRLRKSFSLDESKTKMASCIINSVLSKKMQEQFVSSEAQNSSAGRAEEDVLQNTHTFSASRAPTTVRVFGREDKPRPNLQVLHGNNKASTGHVTKMAACFSRVKFIPVRNVKDLAVKPAESSQTERTRTHVSDQAATSFPQQTVTAQEQNCILGVSSRHVPGVYTALPTSWYPHLGQVRTTQTLPSSMSSTHTIPPSKRSIQTLPPPMSSTHTLPQSMRSTHTFPPSTSSTHTLPPSMSSTNTFPPSMSSTHTLTPSMSSTHTLPPSMSSIHTLSPPISSTHSLPLSMSSNHTPPPSMSTIHTLPPPMSSTHSLPPSMSSPHTLPPSMSSIHTLPPSMSFTHSLHPSMSSTHMLPPPMSSMHTLPPPISSTHSLPLSMSSNHTLPSSMSSIHTLLPSMSFTHSLHPSMSSTQTLPPSMSSTHTLPPSISSTHILPPSMSSTHTLPPSMSSTHTLPPFISSTHILPPSMSSIHTLPPSRSSTHTLLPSMSSTHALPQSMSATHTLPQSMSSTHTLPQSISSTHTLHPSMSSIQTLPQSMSSFHTLPPSIGFIYTLLPSTSSTHTLQPSMTSIQRSQPEEVAGLSLFSSSAPGHLMFDPKHQQYFSVQKKMLIDLETGQYIQVVLPAPIFSADNTDPVTRTPPLLPAVHVHPLHASTLIWPSQQYYRQEKASQ
ncbi:mucin-5B-like isoform X1 [Entelurus aequoreus]|uniref:mucin-5B-like isoform X1 n=2 Tax=Entelurus aequoreus TaxID=161455 RepID=UPI002B1CEAA3|nr:mucin-5B-like isoform X1 [Entelurus aequoreus]